MAGKGFITSVALICALTIPTERLYSQVQNVSSDSLITVTLEDGSKIHGIIIQEDAESITLATAEMLEVKIPKSSIDSIEPLQGRIKDGKFYRFNPNYSRLMFAPTGRPLRKGEGFFSDYWVFFPGISIGITDQISVMAGVSVFPGLDLDEQLLYIAPRIGGQITDKFAVSTGALYVTLGAGEDAAGIAFVVGSFGLPDFNFSVGLGLGYTRAEDSDFEFAKHPILMLGGNIRLSNSVALVSENWIITGEDFDLGEQPFGIALRFFGDHISVDLGAIFVGNLEGLPIPWLTFAYNFGR